MNYRKKIIIVSSILCLLTVTLSCVLYLAYCILASIGFSLLFCSILSLAFILSGIASFIISKKTKLRIPIAHTISYNCFIPALFLVKYYIDIL